MQRLRTLSLPPYRGRDFFATIFVEPDPETVDAFSLPEDADGWGICIHFQPDALHESHVEIARIDTEHGEPHFDHLYEPAQRKEWLGQDYTYEEARQDLLSHWREYADQYFQNHYRPD